MTTAVPFSKQSPAALVFDKASKRCVGWGAFSKKGGVEYDDAHGDHFPDDEFFKAVGGLMKRDYADREINVEHVGAAQGSIVTAWALGEDVAKALKIDTGGNYGVLLDFEPGPELLAKMEAGEMFCLSMEGLARNVQTVAKSAGADIAAAKRKRVMRGVELYKWAVCKAGAHDGAEVALIKTAVPSAEALAAARTGIAIAKDVAGAKKWLDRAIARHERHMAGTEDTSEASQQKMMDEMRSARTELDDIAKARLAKATPALTSADAGHQHAIGDIDEASGCTSSEQMSGMPDMGWHSHLWVKAPDGTIVVAMTLGHTHTAPYTETTGDTTMADANLAASLSTATADLAKSQARCSTLASLLLVAASMPPDVAAYAKSLPAEKLEGFLALTDAERAARAAPIYKAANGDVFYPGEERLAGFAKRADDADAREASVKFEKRATAEIPNLPGTVAAHAFILRAIEQTPGDAEVKKAALATVTAASMAYGEVFKSKGHGGGTAPEPGSPVDAFNQAHAAFAKAKGKQPFEVAGEFAATDEGRRLYAAAYPLDRPRA